MLIKAENLVLSYGSRRVLDGFSAEISCNGITVLTGESGCGKTTLLRVIAGLQKPESGAVSGIIPQETAFMFQENRLLPWRTAIQQITDVLPPKRRGEAEKYLEIVELTGENNSLPSSLSGGMARRLALARTLALGGRLFILDEPFAGVDPERRERIVKRLVEMKLDILAVIHEETPSEAASNRYAFEGIPLRMII